MGPWQLGPLRLDWSAPVFMAVLNATPDSFSDGGQLASVECAIARARVHVEAGAQILDIGGESTRPGAEPIDAEVELARVLPVLEAVRDLPVAISIDTMKPAVARAAVEAGAHLVNDVTGLRNPAMVEAVAELGCHVCVMHMRGEPRTMQRGPIRYSDVVAEVGNALDRSVARAAAAGIGPDRIMLDPGIGFGKTVEHNVALTRALGQFGHGRHPVLYGPSRKSFLGTLTGRDVSDRDRATAAAVALGVLFGAQVFRVHDVSACADAARVASAF